MTRNPFLFFLSALGVLFCAADLPAAQRTFVSAAIGSDANPCTRSAPCRNFAAAITQTDPGGQVIVLDSGGYGVVTINQAVSLISPSGVFAGVTAFSGNAITIDANDTAQVVLSNLTLNSLGATDNGIDADVVLALYVDNCVVSGFVVDGILFNPTTANARFHLRDTVIRNSGDTAMAMFGGTGLRATLDSVQMLQNATGVFLSGTEAMIRNSVASGATQAGFWADPGSRMVIENSVATGNFHGFYSDSGNVMSLSRCTASFNTNGVYAVLAGTTIYVSDSTITTNTNGVTAQTSGVVISRGNNTLQGNTSNGAFSSTFLPN